MIRFVFVLSGDTYIHRESIKEQGFSWDAKEKVWLLPIRNPVQRDEIRHWAKGLKGLTVTEEFASRFSIFFG